MENNHPKRKKDKYNTYTLKKEKDKFFLSFIDVEGNNQELEIDEKLYLLFNDFELEDISYLNKVSRHIEHSTILENSLTERSFLSENSLEDEFLIIDCYARLHEAIKSLPEKQKKRLVKRFFEGMSIEEIALCENCSTRAVDYSLHKAIINLRRNKLLKECFFDIF